MVLVSVKYTVSFAHVGADAIVKLACTSSMWITCVAVLTQPPPTVVTASVAV